MKYYTNYLTITFISINIVMQFNNELKNGIMITSDNLKEIIQTISPENIQAAINGTLHAYGFDLDVFETPTITDYILSNFK